MRKILMLALLAVPVSTLGAYASASAYRSADDSRLTVNESVKTEIASADDVRRWIFRERRHPGDDHEGRGHEGRGHEHHGHDD